MLWHGLPTVPPELTEGLKITAETCGQIIGGVGRPALLGERMHLVHVMSLVMVLGMGVDYGIFCVDSASRGGELGATLTSLLLSCLTTVLVFGTLALSSQPSLRAIGLTTGLGILLSYLLAPVTLVAVGLGGAAVEPPQESAPHG